MTSIGSVVNLLSAVPSALIVYRAESPSIDDTKANLPAAEAGRKLVGVGNICKGVVMAEVGWIVEVPVGLGDREEVGEADWNGVELGSGAKDVVSRGV